MKIRFRNYLRFRASSHFGFDRSELIYSVFINAKCKAKTFLLFVTFGPILRHHRQIYLHFLIDLNFNFKPTPIWRNFLKIWKNLSFNHLLIWPASCNYQMLLVVGCWFRHLWKEINFQHKSEVYTDQLWR